MSGRGRPSQADLRRGEAASFGPPPSPSITASDWRPMVRNTLRGFVTLTLRPSGLVLRECAAHEQGERRWIGLPGKPQLDQDGRHRIDPATGKKLYTPVVEILGKEERDRFQRLALAAVHRLLGEAAP
jgi:hypothetical protein